MKKIWEKFKIWVIKKLGGYRVMDTEIKFISQKEREVQSKIQDKIPDEPVKVTEFIV